MGQHNRAPVEMTKTRDLICLPAVKGHRTWFSGQKGARDLGRKERESEEKRAHTAQSVGREDLLNLNY